MIMLNAPRTSHSAARTTTARSRAVCSSTPLWSASPGAGVPRDASRQQVVWHAEVHRLAFALCNNHRELTASRVQRQPS
jgi:hypothetical protein